MAGKAQSLFTLGLFTLILATLSGCIVVSNSGDRASGKRIKETTLNQFEVGSTTKEWTLAVLGEPSHRETLEDGTEVMRYEYSRKKEQQTVVFILFAGNSDKQEKQTAYFEFKDDVLSRYWVEQD